METIPLLKISTWLVAKIFVLLVLLIYFVFALVMVRQVQLMVSTLKVGFEFPVRALSWVHLIFAGGVFLIALVIL